MTNKVIDFKSAKLNLKEKEEKEFADQLAEDQESATYFAMAAISDILDVAISYGYDPYENPESVKDILLTMEALRGLLLRTIRQDADIQKVADHLFPTDDPRQELRNLIDRINK